MINILITLLFFSGLIFLFRRCLIDLTISIILLGNAINLTIFKISNFTEESFPFIGEDFEIIKAIENDPIPNALVLTAIVISFAILCFLIAITKGLIAEHKILTTELMKSEE